MKGDGNVVIMSQRATYIILQEEKKKVSREKGLRERKKDKGFGSEENMSHLFIKPQVQVTTY